jgi:BA14K-like protein
MKKAALAIVTAIAVGGVTMSASTTADARCYGCALGAGVVAGVIGSAIIGSAIANSQPHFYWRRHYWRRRYYAGPPTYYERPPDDAVAAGPSTYYAPPPDDSVAYCMRRFKSYDPRRGSYLGYDGYRHACP